MPKPQQQVFISVGSRADLGATFLIARRGEDVDWTVPKEAKVGDRLYLIIPSRSGPVQAYGTVVDLPYKTDDFGGRYRATVADIQIVEIPVRLDDLQDRFPNWGYIGNPKSYVKVPREYTEDFEKFVSDYQNVPEWKALIALESRALILAEALKDDPDEKNLIDYDFDEEELDEELDEDEERVSVSIKRRRGQADFRAKLLVAYDKKCAVTGYNWLDALEAAHIVAYKNRASNEISNGLLLRADIHTLFDLNLVGINAEGKVVISTLLEDSSYWYLNGRPAYLPKIEAHSPVFQALENRIQSRR